MTTKKRYSLKQQQEFVKTYMKWERLAKSGLPMYGETAYSMTLRKFPTLNYRTLWGYVQLWRSCYEV